MYSHSAKKKYLNKNDNEPQQEKIIFKLIL